VSGGIEVDMKTEIRALLCGIIIGCSCGASVCIQAEKAMTTAAAPSKEPAAAVSIFNGRDLTGWENMGDKSAWYVKDGVIECNGKYGFWLRYKPLVDDFILKLKYKMSQGGNSGVFIRSLKDGDPPFTGWEVQLLDSAGQDPNKHSAGAVYDILTPMREMSNPAGEWNDLVVKMQGSIAVIWLNGFKIIDTDFDKLDKPIGKFAFAYKDLPRTGYIGLQEHLSPVWFKDISIVPLGKLSRQIKPAR